jgi:hypothetical protein
MRPGLGSADPWIPALPGGLLTVEPFCIPWRQHTTPMPPEGLKLYTVDQLLLKWVAADSQHWPVLPYVLPARAAQHWCAALIQRFVPSGIWKQRLVAAELELQFGRQLLPSKEQLQLKAQQRRSAVADRWLKVLQQSDWLEKAVQSDQAAAVLRQIFQQHAVLQQQQLEECREAAQAVRRRHAGLPLLRQGPIRDSYQLSPPVTVADL